MRKLDYYWMSNENWFHQQDNGAFVVNHDAPPEAQESYKNYIEQVERSEKSVEKGESLD